MYSYSGDFGFITNSTPERDSTSFYGQGTWNHSDSLRTVFGLRHTNDEVYSAVTNFYGRSGTDILETDGNKVTGRFVIEKDIDDNTMVFGSFTRGNNFGTSSIFYLTLSYVSNISFAVNISVIIIPSGNLVE